MFKFHDTTYSRSSHRGNTSLKKIASDKIENRTQDLMLSKKQLTVDNETAQLCNINIVKQLGGVICQLITIYIVQIAGLIVVYRYLRESRPRNLQVETTLACRDRNMLCMAFLSIC